MNRNKKTARIELRVTPEVKKRIEQLANKCGLSTAEYICKRAMGYQPKAAVPEAFFHFNRSLCELLNRELSPETEAAALRLFDEIHAEFMDTKKQTAAEICKEALEWQQPDSGPLKGI